MPTIKFVNEKKEIQVPEGANLRSEALRAGIGVHPGINTLLNCHGFGACATCRVLITKGMENTSPMSRWERLRLKFAVPYIGNEQNMRLACRTRVRGDVEVETKPPINCFGENFFS